MVYAAVFCATIQAFCGAYIFTAIFEKEYKLSTRRSAALFCGLFAIFFFLSFCFYIFFG